jgi:hypothetical protein
MAQEMVVRVVGDSSSYERSLKRSAEATKGFRGELKKLSESYSIASLGKGFVGGVAGGLAAGAVFQKLTSFMGDSVKAAQQSAVAQRSLAAQMRASGESFAQNREEIERTALSYAKFGFTDEDVLQSLTVLERGSRSITTAIRLQGVSADLARAKNLTLAQAANVVAKVFGGQESALRRAVPGLSKTAHGMDLITAAGKRLSGQAAANTTESEKFHSALHNTEVLIGTAMLPAINEMLKHYTGWLTKLSQNKKLQADVNQLGTAGVHVVDAMATAYSGLSSAIGWASKRLGGFWGIVAQMGPVGQAAALTHDAASLFGGGKHRGAGMPNILQGPADAFAGFGAALINALRHPAGARGYGLAGQFNIAQYRLAQAQLTATLADDRRILIVERAITEQQIKQAKTLKDKTALTQQLVGINNQILSIDQASAQAAQAVADARKQAAQQRAADALAARQQYQTPLRLQLAGARADAFAALHPTAAGTPTAAQVTIAKRVKAAALAAINSHKLLAQGLIDAWNVVTQANTTLAAALQAQAGGAKGTYVAASTRAITSGLHLTHLQRVLLEERLAQAAAHRGMRPATGAALGQPIQVHVYVDGHEVTAAVDKHHRQTHQRRGARR